MIEWGCECLEGNMQPHEMLMNIGMLVKGLMQEEIVRGSFAPNSPATIRKKGEGKPPLIDSGTMRQSVNYQIVQKGSYDD